MIDTHSHLYVEDYSSDIDQVLERARDAGVSKIFLPNINEDSVGQMLALARRYDNLLYPMIGLHPEDLGATWRLVLQQMEAFLEQSSNSFIGIGEIGLDYYWDRSQYEEQQEAFAIQLGWAMKYHLPVMIHTRNAHREMVDILHRIISDNDIESTSLGGVFHCFGGTVAEAEELLNFDGFMLGIGGIVTFKKSPLPDVLRMAVPLDRIVLETDSPYLAPVPYRGKRNESAYVVEVARKLSEIYNVSLPEIMSRTTANAVKTFPKCR